jgi:hypothetical protein
MLICQQINISGVTNSGIKNQLKWITYSEVKYASAEI